MPPEKNTESVQTAKPKDAVDSALRLVGQTFKFLKGNFVSIFIKLLKIALTVLLVDTTLWIVAGLLAIGILAAAGAPLGFDVDALVNYVFDNRILLALTIVWFLIAYLAITWITTSISFTAYPIIKEQFEGTYSGIWPISRKIQFRVLGYVLLKCIIMVVFLGVPILGYLLIANAIPIWIGIIILLYVLYASVFLLIYQFLTQFWYWELTVGEKQADEALVASISLVKKNLFGVIVYDVIVVFSRVAIAVPFFMLMLGVNLFLSAGAVAGSMILSSLAIYQAIMLIDLVLKTLIISLGSIVINSIVFPYTYSFWNGLRK